MRPSKFLTFLAALIFLCGCAAKESQHPKPNILWITIEDTSPEFIGCYGNAAASTPTIDHLAKDGVRFTNAFSTGTVCSPSRTALITGVKTYETGTGNHRSKYAIPDFIKGFPYYMQEAGYYTSNNQKTDYNVAGEKQFIAEAWDESSGKAGWWNRTPGQPFFAVFNFNDSHQSRTMTESYSWYEEHVLQQLPEEDRIGEDAFEMPPFYLDSPPMRKQFARVYNSLKLTDNKIAALLDRLEKDGLKDSTIIFFFGDHGEGIPRGKTNGIDLGYRVPFVIWFPEMYKHLSPWGTAGVVTNELIDFTDLPPTLLHLAGAPVPEHMKGRKLMGDDRSPVPTHLTLSSDRSDNGIDMIRSVTDGRFMYSRNFMPFMSEARYIRYMEIGEIKQQMRKDLAAGKLNALQASLFEERPAEFLFDLEHDPWETTNLADDPEFSPVLKRMRGLHRDEVLNSRDAMFLPEYEITQLMDSTTAYEYRLNHTDYPLEKIYDAASLAGFRGADVAAKQVDMLADTNKFVRYWAILGLRSQHTDALAPYAKEIANALLDDYPPVAITAAAVAFQAFDDSQAATILKRYCQHETAQLSLMAINYLLYLDNRQPFAETIRATYAMENQTYDIKAACLDVLGSLNLVPNTPDYRE
ncbi:sulfatase family protein [Parapedobacter indicus]|uniref:Arylsulfatase A n=1 Tax=Parapedobacter indicus TaxID=1477437 RepID=A0A1I3EXA9_9SPHI|nr:sulfatase [Parapedobacter indicus]PPL03458.1 arylsulfatase A-like enzyme [Parapedobacter indicus]SFI03629.1 Arylsulfatase A [Parapedobacter indicus]